MKKIAQFKYPSRQPNRWRHLTTTHTLTYTLGCNKGITLDELIPSYNTFCVRQAKARETYECFGLSSLWLLINQKRCNKFQLDITTQKVVALSCDYFHRMAQNRNALRNWLKKCSIEVCVCVDIGIHSYRKLFCRHQRVLQLLDIVCESMNLYAVVSVCR